jgi:hypothetical protein
VEQMQVEASLLAASAVMAESVVKQLAHRLVQEEQVLQDLNQATLVAVSGLGLQLVV